MTRQAPKSSTPSDRRTGFTLIELIAVVLILGLMMSLVVPNLSATRAGRLRDQAKQIAHRLETARQRAITSGRPHRMYVDLEEGFVRVDWWIDQAAAWAAEDGEDDLLDDEAVAGEDEIDLDGPIQMSPPRDEEPDFHPIAGAFGREWYLDEDYYFVGVDSEAGWFESGGVEIVFGIDGVAEYSVIRMADAWDNEVSLEVEPLIELVRIREAGDD